MSPALWWSLWVLSVLVGIGAGYGLVRFVVAEVLADRARARRGVQLAGAVAFSRKREERPADVEAEPAGAVVLPFLPRAERFPSLAEAIEAEQIRVRRENEASRVRAREVSSWPEAFRPNGGGVA